MGRLDDCDLMDSFSNEKAGSSRRSRTLVLCNVLVKKEMGIREISELFKELLAGRIKSKRSF